MLRCALGIIVNISYSNHSLKTLLCSALVLTTLARCSDNSTNSNSSALSISVNRKTEEPLTVYLIGGSTQSIDVVSSGE